MLCSHPKTCTLFFLVGLGIGLYRLRKIDSHYEDPKEDISLAEDQENRLLLELEESKEHGKNWKVPKEHERC